MAEADAPTRWERVREILDRAAGDSPADYGGAGRFWNLPLTAFLATRLHGVPLVAPPAAAGTAAAAAAGSSCGCRASAQSPAGDPAGERQPPYPGRGAASGLVRGLRGEPPFDGSRFPRLPWGGTAVAVEDAAFISDWIDDGCPQGDREIAALPLAASAASGTASAGPPAAGHVAAIRADNAEAILMSDLASGGREAWDAYAGSPNEYKLERGELKQRMNIDCMTEPQIDELRAAMRELYALNKWPEDRRSYNNIALIHQNHCQHGWERFLPWHRIYLYEFEQALQDHCPGVAMPYWDWTMPMYLPEKPEKGWIIPPALQAFLTRDSLAFLRQAVPELPAPQADVLQREMVDKGKRYTSPSRFFADVAAMIGDDYTRGPHRHRFIDALLAANSLWYPLRFPAEFNGSTIEKQIHYHYPTADDMAQIMSLRTFRDFGGGSLYNDSFGFMDQNPHNTMHIWTGGLNPDFQAAAGVSAEQAGGDRNRSVRIAGRRFHSLDDLYSEPPTGDMLSNLTASNDPIFWPIHANVDRLWSEWQEAHPSSLPVELDAVLTPWSYTIADTLDMARFGYEYVKSTCLVPIGLGAPVGRFVSRPLDIPPAVRSAFRQAEVRLHRVPQLPRSCFIRVFLNLPDADAATPIDDEHYAGYLAVFGHGDCYGGPGHCDLPPARPRKYDLRPRSHNTPRNHRIHVTRAARRLLDAGATSLQITLVVIGADYGAESELLRLDGVSLNFLD